MTNYQSIIDLVKQQDKNGKCGWSTQVFIKLAKDTLLGNFLDRIVWWSDKTSRDDGFFYKSADEWNEELFISYAQVKRLEGKLVEMELIEVKKMMANGAPTMHYRPRMDNLKNNIIELYKKVEIQESRISRKSNIEIQESSISEIQESRISITAKTNKDNNKVLPNGNKSQTSAEKSKTKNPDFPPDTPEARILFARFNQHRQQVKRRQVKSFKTDEQRQKFNRAAKKLGCNEVGEAVAIGLEQEVTTLRGLVNYVEGWAKKKQQPVNDNHQNGTKRKFTPEQLARIKQLESEKPP